MLPVPAKEEIMRRRRAPCSDVVVAAATRTAHGAAIAAAPSRVSLAPTSALSVAPAANGSAAARDSAFGTRLHQSGLGNASVATCHPMAWDNQVVMADEAALTAGLITIPVLAAEVHEGVVQLYANIQTFTRWRQGSSRCWRWCWCCCRSWGFNRGCSRRCWCRRCWCRGRHRVARGWTCAGGRADAHVVQPQVHAALRPCASTVVKGVDTNLRTIRGSQHVNAQLVRSQ
mmetsp:Transcript_1643/g.3578  ORF Transcript_1643/g.3578 Transcript_1643/m.3578 type:complete len:230 (-) Transcript_1643:1701-2390(-)